jgi:hypothetical protein
MKNYEVHLQNSKDGPLEHDYDLKVTHIVCLSHSHGPQWAAHHRGGIVGTLTDTGNDVVIELADRKKPIVLDYKQAAEMQMLLMAAMERDYVTVIKESTLVLRYSGLAE